MGDSLSINALEQLARERGVSIEGCLDRVDLTGRLHRSMGKVAIQRSASKERKCDGKLRHAIESNDGELAIGLLQQNLLPAELIVGYSLGGTALHAASERGMSQVCSAILAHGNFNEKDVEATDNNGRTALHTAAMRGHTAVCQALLQDQRVANIAACIDRYECTALHYAADGGKADFCRALLENGNVIDSLDAVEHRGRNALSLAPQGPRGEAVRELLAAVMEHRSVENAS